MRVGGLLAFGPYRLDLERRVLLRNSEPIPLQQKALEILIVLVRRRGEVVSKDDLMKAIWHDAFVEDANLTQNIFMLRKALGEGPRENRYVATMPGRGYCFVAAVEEVREQDVTAQTTAYPSHDNASNEERKRGKRSWGAWRAARIGILLTAAAILPFAVTRSLPLIARHYNNKGVSLQQAGGLKSAIGDFQWALRLSPGYAEAHYNLADAYEELPAYDKALEEYQKAIEADPTLYEAYNNLARLYIKRLRDPGAALGLLERAINLNPQEPSVQYSLYKNYGWANFELHLWGQAEASLRRAIALDPSRGEAHCLLAKVLDVPGNPTSAFKEWETCAAYSSQTEVEPEWRAEAQERLNNNKEAEK